MKLLIHPGRATRSFLVPHLPALQITPQRIAVAMGRMYRLRLAAPETLPARAGDAAIPLDAAALAWREGRLRKARELYERMLRQRPDDWRAMFQLAWLDAAFDRLEPQTAAWLDRDDLTASGRERLGALADAQNRPALPGDELAWDFDVLRTTGTTQSAAWWETHGRAAWHAGLFGVAAGCVEEVARRSDALRDDPPAWMRAAASDAERHLKAIAAALSARSA